MRGWQRDVEGDAIVARGERLQVGADLVGCVAATGDAVRACDDEIHQAVLHEMTAGVVGDDRMRHAVLGEFPGGEARALVAGTRFIDPDVHRDAGVVRRVDRRRGRAVIDEGEPAGVAMCEHVDGRRRFSGP